MVSEEFSKRISELLHRSLSRNIYTYTPFLNPTAQAEVSAFAGENVVFFGGADFAERKIARFGKEEDVGYTEEPPIVILKLTPKGAKFTRELTHRDYLGAILNLGIERDKIGDIFVNGENAYLVADEKIGDFLIENLGRAGRNTLFVSVCDEVPEEFRPKVERKSVSVQSNRVDAIISRVFNLSREDGSSAVKDGAALVNGKEVNPSYPLKEGDAVSVKGYGKFIFSGEGGTSKKGKTYIEIELFI